MSRSSAMMELGCSSMSVLVSKKDSLGDSHFRWQSLKKFVYFACTFSANTYNFDIFSRVYENVRIIDFLLVQGTIGLSYMCMDGFIRQYTRRYDCNKYLNPLLRGLSYGRFAQTSLFAVLHANYLADCLRFLVASFRDIPPWMICVKSRNSSCVTSSEIMYRCTLNRSTLFTRSSAYHNYLEAFGAIDRTTLTTRLFILGLVWMMVFFFASVTEETVVKIFKLAFLMRTLSTIISLISLLVFSIEHGAAAFSQMLDISAGHNIMLAVRHTLYTYGIGFLGIYDFGTISTYTMIDTAAVIYLATFTCLAFLRSLVVRILYLAMKKCVILDLKFDIHVMFYGMLPLAAEFIYAHRLYMYYFYGTILNATLVFMTNLILMLSKFLSYEFHSVKQIYIVGLLCCLGFALSIPMLALLSQLNRGRAITGVDLTGLYLGGSYAAIVMWLYGLKKFCTDIQFWLGFRPTRYWTTLWAILPVILFCFMIAEAVELIYWQDSSEKWASFAWIGITFSIVGALNIKTMAGFLMRNNLTALFKSHKNYGPPDAEDRKRRLYYSEYTRQRKCRHNCLVIDEWIDCNHQKASLESKIRLSSSSSDSDLTNLYDAKTTSRLRSVGALNPTASINRPPI